MKYQVRLTKERFKFSSAHFTVFSASEFERLHGHNYSVEAKLVFDGVSALGLTAPFAHLKRILQEVCEKLDEKVLIAANNPHTQLKKDSDGLWVYLANKKYYFPQEDLEILPLVNISSEELASYLCQQLKNLWRTLEHLREIHIRVEETCGQSVEVGEVLP